MATRYEHAKPSRNDPFYEPPLHKAFYHPTRQHDLQDDKKWVALAPDRGKDPPDARDIHFLQPTNTYTSQPTTSGASPGDTSSKFDESWPASERPSTLDALQDESAMSVPHHEDSGGPMKPLSALLGEYGLPRSGHTRPLGTDFLSEISKVGDTSALSQTTCSTEPAARTSTLSKYIERFRHGEPLSREQRAQREATTNPADFWWLRSDSPQGSSTPRDTSDTSQAKVTSRSQGHSRSRFSSNAESVRTRGTTDLDSETLKLQEKTERLLERSESSLESSAPVVSTVGLGSDTSSSSTTVPHGTGPQERSYLPSYLATGRSVAAAGGEVRQPLKPEDDILYQWRQQRRMEALRNKASRFLTSCHGTSAEVTDEVESKLAEFRRKVSTGPQERVPPADVPRDKETPLSGDTCSKPTEVIGQNVDPAKVDAICQTRTNNDAVCQTSPNTEQEPTATHAPITSTQHRSPIASPSMVRRKFTNHPHPVESTEMEPHFHLSCDILPCPHVHHHRTPENKNHPSKSSGSPERRMKHKSYLSDTDTDESRPPSHRNISNEEPVKDIGPLVLDSCSDAEYENYKKRHMVQLQEELESISSEDPGRGRGCERSSSDQRASPSKHHSRERKDQKKDSRKDDKEKRQDCSRDKGTVDRKDRQKRSRERDGSHHSSRERSKERDKPHRTQPHREGGQSQRSQSQEKKDRDRQRVEKPATSTRERNEKHISESNAKEADRKHQPQSDHSSENSESGLDQIPTHQPADPDVSSRKSDKSKETKLKPKLGRHSPEPKEGRPVGARGGGRASRGEVARGSLTDASICDVTPLCHSSPIRGQRAVTPTIQQVVTEHLFEDTEVNASQTASDQTQHEHSGVDDGLAVSDGDEYMDDDLLQELRARREHYRQRLEILDQLLTLTVEP